MKQYKIGACGNFDLDPTYLNGQIIRTCSIMDQLEKEIGADCIKRVSYADWKRHPFRTIKDFLSLFFQCENVLLFPDLRAVRGLVPMASFLRKKTKTKAYYNVIGGWLPEFLHSHKYIRRCTVELDGLFVQTKSLSEQLKLEGVLNTTVFPNFKNLKIYTLDEKPSIYTKPLALVYMSRISERKGLTELVDVVSRINRYEIKYTLDIYGSVKNGFEEKFEELKGRFGESIRYKGQVDPLKTSLIMKDYFLHVFPTTFQTEGYPGSVLDALSAGVPTLSARWLSYEDVLEEGRTGLSYTLGNWEELEKRLEEIWNNPEIVWRMREACILEAEKYRPETVIKIMINKLNL